MHFDFFFEFSTIRTLAKRGVAVNAAVTVVRSAWHWGIILKCFGPRRFIIGQLLSVVCGTLIQNFKPQLWQINFNASNQMTNAQSLLFWWIKLFGKTAIKNSDVFKLFLTEWLQIPWASEILWIPRIAISRRCRGKLDAGDVNGVLRSSNPWRSSGSADATVFLIPVVHLLIW